MTYNTLEFNKGIKIIFTGCNSKGIAVLCCWELGSSCSLIFFYKKNSFWQGLRKPLESEVPTGFYWDKQFLCSAANDQPKRLVFTVWIIVFCGLFKRIVSIKKAKVILKGNTLTSISAIQNSLWVELLIHVRGPCSSGGLLLFSVGAPNSGSACWKTPQRNCNWF